jgi:hypothetical protein
VRVALWQVLLGAALFCAILVPVHPLTSTDLFNYIVSARVQWVHAANPLTTPPLAYPEDPFYRLLFFWRDVPSPYGPLWSLTTFVPHTVGGGNAIRTVLAYKFVAAGSLLVAGLCVAAAANGLRAESGPAAALALTWNPLAVWHVAGNGHNDALMAALLALAAWLLVRERLGPALLALTASALVKFATLLVLPLVLVWWWRRRQALPLRRLLPWIAGSAALAILAYAPYWDGADTFRTSLNEGTYFAVSGPAALRGVLVRVLDRPVAEGVAASTGRFLFVVVYAGLAWRLLRRTPAAGAAGDAAEALIVAGCIALAAYVVLAATYFAPWYLLWPLTLAVIVHWRREVLLPILGMTLGAMGVLVWATWARERWSADPSADWYPMHLFAFLNVVVPAVVLWWWARRHRPPALSGPASADVDAPALQGQVAGTGVEG